MIPIRCGRALVELLLWLAVIGGWSLLLTWWDVRPGALTEDTDIPGGLETSAVVTGSFLLVTGATALVLFVRRELTMARLAAGVCAIAMWVGAQPWGTFPDGDDFERFLRWGAVLLVIAVAAAPLWGDHPQRRPLPRPVAWILAALLLMPVVLGLWLLVGPLGDHGLVNRPEETESGWYYLAPFFLVMVLVLPAFRAAVADVVAGRRRVPESPEIDA